MELHLVQLHIYLRGCLQSQAWMSITGWNSNPKYNSSWIQSDGRVLISVISVGHVTLAGKCDTVRRCDGRGRGGLRGLSRTLVDNPPEMHKGAGMMRLGW